GFVRVVRRRDGTERWADYLRPGDTFGGPQRDTAAGAFLRYEAASVAEVFLIDRDDLQDLAGAHPDLAHAFERPARREDARGAEPAQRGLTGALQAHQLLVIDTRLCVDCDNCVDACERRHGMPRLDRRGTATIDGPWQVPTSCYHCVDPLCLYCSVDGIVREPSGEIRIVEENCIGCGQCAERCPYDNIFMVAREPQRRSLLEWLVPKPVRRLFGVRDGRVILEDHEQLAVKCDLCHGYGDGPACVRSCPTGAAQRDEPAAIFGVGRS
ncbi:MAG: 4Fe-4S dicluster domain-containing protein, partial [Planctomycetes bacterium]|nr:4Fe-4S dicluster domain-containing protein [Planctomycetota bacterium]